MNIASSSRIGAQAIPVTVVQICTEAEGVVSLSLEAAEGGRLPEWAAGAHVDLAIAPGFVRQYSLCGDPCDHSRWRLAVLREATGRGASLAIHESIRIGDRLAVSPPRNHFPLVAAAEYVIIAGGIGITPILPMIRELAGHGKDWRLLYGGRTRAAMAFLPELEGFGDRVVVRPEDEFGLLDIAAWIGPARPGCVIYCCGPERLIAATEALAVAWPAGALQSERFRPPPQSASPVNTSFEVVLARSGRSVVVRADQTIADSLDAIGIVVPRSCNEGICGTCLTKVLEGTPDHRDSFLRGRQRAENKRITVCCSRALTPQLVLDL